MADQTFDEVHRCAICPRAVRRGYLMCYGHWRRVPQPLQDAVNRTWRNYTDGVERNTLSARAAYMQARQAAIDAVAPTRATPEQVKAEQVDLLSTINGAKP